MGGGNKTEMKNQADEHFKALRQIVPEVHRLMLFDYDSEGSYHPDGKNPASAEWKRKNIENYLLVPDAWKRSALQEMGFQDDDLFAQPALQVIDQFFANEALTLPHGQRWRDVRASAFGAVDGKRMLFENNDSLFQLLREGPPPVTLLREQVALNMTADEIHEDVHEFIGKVIALAGSN